jgi:hypothetical protein
MLLSLLVGLVAAFVGSMPVAGPISVLVLERGLDGDRRGAIAIAVGSAFAEMIYAGLAFAGVSTLLTHVPVVLPIVRGLGAAILFGVGMYFVLRKKNSGKKKSSGGEERHGAQVATGALHHGAQPDAVRLVDRCDHDAARRRARAPNRPRCDSFRLGRWMRRRRVVLGARRGSEALPQLVRPTTLERGVRVMGYVLIVAGVAMGVRAVALPLLAKHA